MFLVEGNKIIEELADSPYRVTQLYSVEPSEISLPGRRAEKITEQELKKISFLQHPKDSVAVCELREMEPIAGVKRRLILDGIQDPGNMGTLIRLADWFGIEEIICSHDTADFYNPKVLQASKGSFARMNIVYTDLEAFLKASAEPILTTDMEGESIYTATFPERFNLILGNEGNGVRPEIEKLAAMKISIPRFGRTQKTESLNVAMAAGIILGQIYSRS